MIKLAIAIFIMVGLVLFIKLIITDYDKCYSDMEREGYAVFECCGGLTGGTKSTDYLSETCVSCPYLVLGCNPKYGKEEIRND